MQFMMANIQIIYKMLVYIRFFFADYKDNKIETHQKYIGTYQISLYRGVKGCNL